MRVVGLENCHHASDQFQISFLKEMSSSLSLDYSENVWERLRIYFFCHLVSCLTLGLLGCWIAFVPRHLVSLNWTLSDICFTFNTFNIVCCDTHRGLFKWFVGHVDVSPTYCTSFYLIYFSLPKNKIKLCRVQTNEFLC